MSQVSIETQLIRRVLVNKDDTANGWLATPYVGDCLLARQKTTAATAIAPIVNQFAPTQVLRSKCTRKIGLYNAANTPKIQVQAMRFISKCAGCRICKNRTANPTQQRVVAVWVFFNNGINQHCCGG